MAASRFTRVTPLLRSLASTPTRPSTSAAVSFTSRFPTSSLRCTFSTTSTSYASEAPPQSPWEARGFQSEVPMFDRLQSHPEVLQSIEQLAEIVKEKTGVDLRNGDAPTMSLMYKLAQDPELRAAAESLMAALRSAGIEVDPKQAFNALQMMGGAGFEDKNSLKDLHEAVRKGEGEDGGDGEGKEGEGKKAGKK
ncbi:BZ3500_MvSof-1268-A1-R1_Chr2-1g04390 [Microbotryum saponariae]|uniref:BZ3500_MvSof-1268-A1-R1_Chr2-1g04390 protein n=1 Tax=Microbotryum saponariae TaxID=289078 RepID=A0A2X0K8F8_9BASI|nr:BZ3500_MvSof-1268-A1-R1_Chr2-1g04390 [Microbotryum saponariae]SCZ91604.1 BZ3501_MvSof-1269-A2-R1_Chr2-1g04046 [Microbotryum saponariae]